jgi:hypothetical protein
MFGVPIDEAEKEVAREKLAQMDSDPKFGARPAWALALDAMTRDDSEAYQTYRSRLLDADPSDSLQWSLAVVMGTLELANGGKVREALLESERLLAYDSAGRGVDPFARALLYWSRAEWFESLDLWIQAEREWLWYENLDFGAWPDGNVQAGEIDWMLGTYARLERAEAQLFLGRTAEACVHLARIRELWAEAEPAMERHRQRADSLFAAECQS